MRSIRIGRSISPRAAALAELGDQVDRCPVGLAPARAPPAGPDDEVRAGFEQDGHAIRLQIGPIGEPDLAFDDRDPIERLARSLIRQFEMTEAFMRKIEGAVDAPQLALRPRAGSRLGNRGGVDDADHATLARLRRGSRERPTHQHGEPVPTPTQAIQQRHIGNVDEPDRRRPGRRRPQPSLAQTVGQDQPQQIDRVGDLPRSQERSRLAGGGGKLLHPAEPGHNPRPVFIHKRFASHSMLESQPIRTRNTILAPMRESGDPETQESWIPACAGMSG